MTREEKIDELRKRTLDEARQQLHEKKRSVIVRPTGFGKTWLLVQLTMGYKKVLYLYPANVIAETVKERQEMLSENESIESETIETYDAFQDLKAEVSGDIELMSYMMFSRLKRNDVAKLDYDLVICDEVHRIGGEKTKRNMWHMMQTHPNTHFAGATATPNRSDGFDVVSVFFSDIMVSSYNLHDAIRDGVLQKPNYCYCTTDIEKDLENEAAAIGENVEHDDVRIVLNKAKIELATLFNMPSIIRRCCNNYVNDTSYMKFIAFFASFKQIDMKAGEVINWFKEAFPNHSIRTLYITSRNNEEKQNVERLSSLKSCSNTIDIIISIDMLNMGYHVNDLTGILMYRGTQSDIIYAQQLGRVLTSGTDKAALVFDVVDNLHRQAVYDITDEYGNSKQKGNKKETIWMFKDGQIIDDEGNQAPYELKDGIIYDMAGNKTELVIDEETGFLVYEMYKHDDSNKITEEYVNRIDLTDGVRLKGEMATYQDIIRKLVASPMAQRCRSAFYQYFKQYCDAQNIPYPITQKDLRYLNNCMDDKAFQVYLADLIAKNKLPYNFQDANFVRNMSAAFGLDPEYGLDIFAYKKQVREDAILKMLGAA